MNKRFGMCLIGLCLMAVNGFGQAPAEPLPGVNDMPPPDFMAFTTSWMSSGAPGPMR